MSEIDNDLIERVAKALAESGIEGTDFKWDGLPEQSHVITSKADYRYMAKLVVYPEPTAANPSSAA